LSPQDINAAITVTGLGKRYVVNELRHRRTLSERMAGALGSLLRRSGASAAEPDLPDSIWALRNISFSVYPGEVLGVIGRNGSGKSTLMKLLARITCPTEGGALLNGRVGALLEVGTGFHPDLSGRENILLNGTIIGMSPREIRAREADIIGFSEIGQFIDTPVKHYSSGMFMRLAFAVAAHLQAEIMLVDEVLAVGDASFQEKCKARIKDIARSGRTVLFTSHDMRAIRALCQRALVLHNGRIAHLGDVEEAVRQYDALAAAR
jgi:lipopolysaccharide transport system ATP-binding protein